MEVLLLRDTCSPKYMRKHFIIFTIFLMVAYCGTAIAVTAGKTAGQQEQRPREQKNEPLVRIETELVQIDVVIEDEKGRLVRDLKREDFRIFEDGKPQEIANFSIGTASRPAQWVGRRRSQERDTPPATEVTKTAQVVKNEGRSIVLAIDDLHLSAGSLMAAKQALLRFVDQQMESGDRSALVTTSGALSQYQQFTDDREVLRRAINRLNLRERTVTTRYDVPRITPYQAELIDNNDPEALEIAVQELMVVQRMDRRQATGIARGRANQILAENNSITISTLSTLENVIRDLSSLPGRKVLVLLSDGFLLGSFSNGRYYDVRRVTDAATRAGVVIYSIDARGLVAMPGDMDASQPGGFTEIMPGARSRISNGSIEAQRNGIFALAADTGGQAIFNNNDLSLGMRRVLEDTDFYYLLAFEPTASYRDGKYRRIEVRLPGYPKYRIRTRKGYFAPDEKKIAKEEMEKEKLVEASLNSVKDAQKLRDLQIRMGLSALSPIRDLPLGVTASYLDTHEMGSMIDIAAHIDAAGLKLREESGRHRGRLEIDSFIFDEKGRTIDTRAETINLDLQAESLERAQRYGLGYRRLFKIDPGLYQIRAVVRQHGSYEIGSASTWVVVPDLTKKQLTMSSIFLTESENTNAGDAEAAKARSLIYRRFRRGSKINFLIFAYNAQHGEKGTPDVAIQSQIHAGPRLVFASPLNPMVTAEAGQPTDPDRIPYYAQLNLETFEPGHYELRLIVIDRHAKTTTRRTIGFDIE